MTASRFASCLWNEARKGLLFAWSERLQILIELPMFAIFVLVLGPLFGAGSEIASGRLRWSLAGTNISVLLLWATAFVYFYMQSVKLFWRLLGEIQSGTLEQVYLSPLPSWLVAAFGRLVAALAESLFVAAAMYGIVSIFARPHYSWRVVAVIPVALLIVSGVGFALIIGGLTLMWKRVEMIQDALLTLVFIASSGAVPLLTVPGWYAAAGRAFPMTSFVAALNRILVAHRPGLTMWGTGGLVWMLATATAYLSAGILVFRAGERFAKRRGALGRY